MGQVTLLDDIPLQCDNNYTRMISGQSFALIDHLELDSGEFFEDCPIAFKTFGRLNEERNNVLVICHALTGSADASDWWSPLFGKSIDHTRFFVFCANVLGSPYGSASSLTLNGRTGRAYGPEFPRTTVGDDVRAQRLIMDALGVKSIAAVIGGSMGGMAVLEWAARSNPGYISTIIPIATAASTSAWGISWNEAQRRCIMADARFNRGWYETSSSSGQPVDGLSAARMVAMLTYRSAVSFEERFGRTLEIRRQRADTPQERQPDPKSPDPVESGVQTLLFAAQSSLQYQGQKFVERFDANCCLHLLQKLDSYQLAADDIGIVTALEKMPSSSLVVSVASDTLFPPREQARLAEYLPDAKLHIWESTDGHDGFLLGFEELNRVISEHLRVRCPSVFETEPVIVDGEKGSGNVSSRAGVEEQW